MRFLYAGNRGGVLQRMLELDLNVVGVLPVKNSHLENEAAKLELPTFPVATKKEASSRICESNFDVLISCGFPFILPISRLQKLMPAARFVNIHPSYLPDLRGADPIPGAILHSRDSGVSCHLMDDGIDTGDLISQRRLPYAKEWDAATLYQLCFSLEADIFCEALKADFTPMEKEANRTHDPIYYSFSPDDLLIDVQQSDEEIIGRIRAFNSASKGARLKINSVEYRAFEGGIIPRPKTSKLYPRAVNNEILAVFNDSILVSRSDSLLRFGSLDPKPTVDLVGKFIL
jgi:methionyl-tRNA formyltransferase